jgi:hypothetical protein
MAEAVLEGQAEVEVGLEHRPEPRMPAMVVVAAVLVAERAAQRDLGVRLMLQAAADEGKVNTAVESGSGLDEVAIDKKLGRGPFASGSR